MPQKINILVFCLILGGFVCPLHSFPLHRVILGCDANPMYLEFWPVVAKTWKSLVGVQPTLALIADENVYINEKIGDVIRFPPIPGIPTSFQAQVIRLLLPAYFENDFCIISDMDMIPLQKKHWHHYLKNIPANGFALFNNNYPGILDYKEFPMCYIAAQGKTFKEIFSLNDTKDIPDLIRSWHALNYGWTTDQKVLYDTVLNWKDYTTRCFGLNAYDPAKRVDRANWGYNATKLKNQYYVDAHLLRPYNTYKKKIDTLVRALVGK